MINRSYEHQSIGRVPPRRAAGSERDLPGEASVPPAESVVELADVFGLLADAGRLRVLIALRQGERCVGDLARIAGTSDSATSHHLRLLRAHRVVRARRLGRMAYYRIADAHVNLLLDVALAHIGHAPATSHPERGAGWG